MRARAPGLSIWRLGTDGRSGWTVTVDGDRSAALLVRVWIEEGGAPAFRCRLTAVNTSPGPQAGQEDTVAVASSSEEVVDAVRTWLAEFVGGVPGPVDGD